ncbi:hypothetical protein ElyMa_006257500 [Elysia marginata]|uniref:Ig-like domain-containing protein n=1 Tax=Elysia marginata TaxID=1093978 RepID=A0AAV4H986_9GAST|nr:hypothetical protein ElyMa_006257500 [Elysia marginata]
MGGNITAPRSETPSSPPVFNSCFIAHRAVSVLNYRSGQLGVTCPPMAASGCKISARLPIVVRLPALIAVLLTNVPQTRGQFNFGSLYDFDLVSDVIYPVPGSEITLSCSRTEQYQRKSSNSFLNEDNVISWEVNETPVLTTTVDGQGKCKIGKPTQSGILGRRGFGQSRPLRLPNASCSDDGVTIKLTIHQWSPLRLAGDVWRCLEFPFAESTKLDLQSFVPVTNVAIKQVIDNGGQYSESRGTIVTCRTSACRPRASIDWFLQPVEGGAIRLTSALGEQVTADRDELSVTTSAILFSSDQDHGKRVYCASSNLEEQGGQGEQALVTSRNITVRVKCQWFSVRVLC